MEISKRYVNNILDKIQFDKKLQKRLRIINFAITIFGIFLFFFIVFGIGRNEGVFAIINYFSLFNSLSGLLLYNYFEYSILFYHCKFLHSESNIETLLQYDAIKIQLIKDIEIISKNKYIDTQIDNLNNTEIIQFLRKIEIINWKQVGKYYVFLYLFLFTTVAYIITNALFQNL